MYTPSPSLPYIDSSVKEKKARWVLYLPKADSAYLPKEQRVSTVLEENKEEDNNGRQCAMKD